ncbi:MAG: hypothetical protein ISR76_03725 [Planctomycetes bacterium]|nr:hypothetical protein [Planctomycetota bacterium]
MLLLSLASPLLLAWPAAPQATEPPFHLELPAGYGAFESSPEYPGWWLSRHQELPAAFTVRHELIAAAGADAGRLAEQRRRDYWTPGLSKVTARIEPWTGSLAGAPAAGSVIRTQAQDQDRIIVERFQVHLDHLIALTWEGGPDGYAQAQAVLDGFRPPPDWRPAPLELDSGRGGGPAPLASPGHFQIVFDAATEKQDQQVWVTVLFQAAPWLAERGKLRWRIPGEAELVELELDQGVCRIEYPLVHGSDPHRAHELGLAMDRSSLATAQVSLWLAAPALDELLEHPERQVTPPSWQLEARVPAHVTALSAAPADSVSLDQEAGARVIQFPGVASGAGWPFVIMASLAREEVAGLTLMQRVGAKSRDADAPLRFLARVQRALEARLPAAAEGTWAVTSFPATGDRVLPGLLLLDEERGWLRQAIDQDWGQAGSTRRRGLAELVVSRAFGLRLRGSGSAAPFLETSLTAYLAQALLAELGFGDEAEAVAESWRQHDAAAGPLPAPLSLLPRTDLLGPQRLLGRGPLVWQAIERRAGRKRLDAVLSGYLKRGGFWTTEELRAGLEGATGDSWEEFFRLHVYGRKAPPLD